MIITVGQGEAVTGAGQEQKEKELPGSSPSMLAGFYTQLLAVKKLFAEVFFHLHHLTNQVSQ